MTKPSKKKELNPLVRAGLALALIAGAIAFGAHSRVNHLDSLEEIDGLTVAFGIAADDNLRKVDVGQVACARPYGWSGKTAYMPETGFGSVIVDNKEYKVNCDDYWKKAPETKPVAMKSNLFTSLPDLKPS